MCLVVNGHKTLEGFFIFSLRVVVARYSQLIKRLPSADKSVTLKHSTKLCGFTRLVGPFVAEIYSGDGDCVYHFFFRIKDLRDVIVIYRRQPVKLTGRNLSFGEERNEWIFFCFEEVICLAF